MIFDLYPLEICGILTTGNSCRLLRRIRVGNEYKNYIYQPQNESEIVTILVHMMCISEEILDIGHVAYEYDYNNSTDDRAMSNCHSARGRGTGGGGGGGESRAAQMRSLKERYQESLIVPLTEENLHKYITSVRYK